MMILLREREGWWTAAVPMSRAPSFRRSALADTEPELREAEYRKRSTQLFTDEALDTLLTPSVEADVKGALERFKARISALEEDVTLPTLRTLRSIAEEAEDHDDPAEFFKETRRRQTAMRKEKRRLTMELQAMRRAMELEVKSFLENPPTTDEEKEQAAKQMRADLNVAISELRKRVLEASEVKPSKPKRTKGQSSGRGQFGEKDW